MKQTVRIIGGQLKGKNLPFPDLPGLRPTPNRIRETLFNWLMNDIRFCVCLDAFAGSGALGIEAVSRGAPEVTLLEQSPVAFKALQQTVRALAIPQLKIVQADACAWLAGSQESYDLIFLDPPFASDLLTRCLTILQQGFALKPQGLVYIESSQPLELDPEFWIELKSKKAGDVYFGLYRLSKNA